MAALFALPSSADEAGYQQSWGPAVGSAVTISAPDQTGTLRDIADLSGDQGLLIFLNRSADW